MAGRSLDKLASVRDAIGAPADTPLIVADASDPASLKAMVDQTKSVHHHGRPYQLYGTELVAACAASGTDYFDLCGEPVWMRQMIDAHEATAQAQRRAHRVFLRLRFAAVRTRRVLLSGRPRRRLRRAGQPRQGPRPRHEGHVLGRHGGEHARRLSRQRQRTRVWWRCCEDPFALTPGFEGPKQPPGNKPLFDEDLQSWTAPFVMATINTRNVHRSNMLMGFPYGQDFVYDEMVLTGPGEQGEANAKRIVAANNEKMGGAGRTEAGRGAVEGRARDRLLRSAVRRPRARRPSGPRRGHAAIAIPVTVRPRR